MTVILMSRSEIDRMTVLRDLAEERIRVSEAATLMGVGRRQVFRLAKAFRRCGVVALVSRDREDGRETQLSEKRTDQLQPVIATLLLSLALWLGIWGIVTLLVSIEL